MVMIVSTLDLHSMLLTSGKMLLAKASLSLTVFVKLYKYNR